MKLQTEQKYDFSGIRRSTCRICYHSWYITVYDKHLVKNGRVKCAIFSQYSICGNVGSSNRRSGE